MTNPNHDASNMVNLARYPIADLESADGTAFARNCREEYLQTGLCMLTEKPPAMPMMPIFVKAHTAHI